MRIYDKNIFSEEVNIQGRFQPGGFISNEDYDVLYGKYWAEIDSLIVNINLELFDLADSNKPIAKELNKLDDMRVEVASFHGKLAIWFPMEVRGDKILQKTYIDIVKGVLGYSIREQRIEKKLKEQKVDIKQVIQDLQGNFSKDNEAQMKGIQLLKGLATNDDPMANEFMQKLDKATTEISKEILKNKGNKGD